MTKANVNVHRRAAATLLSGVISVAMKMPDYVDAPSARGCCPEVTWMTLMCDIYMTTRALIILAPALAPAHSLVPSFQTIRKPPILGSTVMRFGRVNHQSPLLLLPADVWLSPLLGLLGADDQKGGHCQLNMHILM
jgi:hypothetical protein